MHLALTMSRPFPREKLLSAPWKSTEWNPRIIRELIEERMRPEECRIMIASQEPVEGRTYELKEKWYGTEYTIVPLSEKLLEVSLFPPSRLPSAAGLTSVNLSHHSASPLPTFPVSAFPSRTSSSLPISRSRTRLRSIPRPSALCRFATTLLLVSGTRKTIGGGFPGQEPSCC